MEDIYHICKLPCIIIEPGIKRLQTSQQMQPHLHLFILVVSIHLVARGWAFVFDQPKQSMSYVLFFLLLSHLTNEDSAQKSVGALCCLTSTGDDDDDNNDEVVLLFPVGVKFISAQND